jgi:uncharacterized membrane protein
MFGEFNFYGIAFPGLLLVSLLTLLGTRMISYVLARKGFYRHVWHPALFDSSLFIIVLGVFFTIFSKGGI